MKTLSITIFIVLICIDFNVLNAQTLTQPQITAIENAITEEMETAGIPGAALAIINNNQVVLEKSFGLANSQTKIAMTDSLLALKLGIIGVRIMYSLPLLSSFFKFSKTFLFDLPIHAL